MSDEQAVYPRKPVIAHRRASAPGRPEGWSTFGRTWFTDEQMETEFVPAEVFEALLDAAVCHECREATREAGECALCNALAAYKPL